MSVFDKLFTNKEEASESGPSWADWQRRSFIAVLAIHLLAALALFVLSPRGRWEMLGSFTGSLIFGYLIVIGVTKVTRWLGSKYQNSGRKRHFSERYWAAVSYTATALSPVIWIGLVGQSGSVTVGGGIIGGYMYAFVFVFVLTLPVYELSKAVRLGYRRIQNKRATS